MILYFFNHVERLQEIKKKNEVVTNHLLQLC